MNQKRKPVYLRSEGDANTALYDAPRPYSIQSVFSDLQIFNLHYHIELLYKFSPYFRAARGAQNFTREPAWNGVVGGRGVGKL